MNMHYSHLSDDFEDYPDPREYNDPNEALELEESERLRIIEILEEGLSDRT